MTGSLSLPDHLTLFVDPGEDTGWCLARGHILLGASTTKLWAFGDDVWTALAAQDGIEPTGRYTELIDPEAAWVLEGRESHVGQPIKSIVCEDWRLYPWKLKSLGWDQCRTARLIGSLTQATRFFGLDFHLQPASIKEEAQRCGAEEFFYRPLHENRHQNDAILHYAYYSAFNREGSGRTPSNFNPADLEAEAAE